MDKLLLGGLGRKLASFGKGGRKELRILVAKRPVSRPNVAFSNKLIIRREIHSTPSLRAEYFTKEHEWIKMDGDGVGTVGITAYAQEQLGDIVYCELPDPGSDFAQGDTMAVIESVKAASDLFAPVSGEIVENNGKVVEDPSLITSSPTDEGWLVRMKLSNLDELKELLDSAAYAEFTKEDA